MVLVGLDKELTKATLDGTESDLHYLLGTLFSNKLEAVEKIQLLDRQAPALIKKYTGASDAEIKQVEEELLVK